VQQADPVRTVARRSVPRLLERTDDIVDLLLLHQLRQDTEPDANRERRAGRLLLSRRAARATCTRSGSNLIPGRRRDRYVAVHGGSSSIWSGSPRTLTTTADAAGGTAVKLYEFRDTLSVRRPCVRSCRPAAVASASDSWCAASCIRGCDFDAAKVG
jgi:hypothetical protein